MATDYKERASLPRRGEKNKSSVNKPKKRASNRRKRVVSSGNAAPKESLKNKVSSLDLNLPNIQQNTLVAGVIGLVIIVFVFFLSSLSGGKDKQVKTSPILAKKIEPQRISRPLSKHIEKIQVPAPVKITRETPLKSTINSQPIRVAQPKQVAVKIKQAVVKPTKLKPVVQVKKPEEIKYQFYEVLPEAEFIIPDYEVKTRKREERVGKVKANVDYVIQVGAFRAEQDAKSLRAKLILMNFVAKIEKVTIKSVVWYRVKLGPYKQMKTISTLLSRLRANGMDAIVSEVKH